MSKVTHKECSHRLHGSGGLLPLISSGKQGHKRALTVAGISLIPALGIACFRLSAWTLYTSEIGAQDPSMLFVSRALQLCAIILALVIDRYVSYSKSMLLRVIGVAAALAMFSALLYLVAPNEAYVYVGMGINGAASGVLMLGWGFFLCSTSTRVSAFSITLAFALYGAMTWVLFFMPQSIIAGMTVLFPLLTFIGMYKCINSIDTQLIPDPPAKILRGTSVPWSVFSLLFICTIASILAKFFAPMGPVLRSSPYYLFWPALFIGIFLIYAVWMLVLKREDHDMLWPIYVLVIFGGLLAYSSFSTTQPEFAAGVFRATSECLMLFCWVVTASVVYRGGYPRVFFFGLSILIFVVPPTIVSSLLSMIFPAGGSEGNEVLAISITAIIAFVLVVAAGMTLTAHAITNALSKKNATEAPVPTSAATALDVLAAKHGLTKRECEVAQCLIKGYTFVQTAETLFISLDTVRTHAKSLYKKMGIHKKQQLIIMIEEQQQT